MTHKEMIRHYIRIAQACDQTELFRLAQEAMDGMLVLNGTGPAPVFVGKPPHWHENPCGIGGYIWTISRLKYMTTLCKAFLVSGRTEYLDKVKTDLENWFSENPAPPVPKNYEEAVFYHGVHHWRMLEVGYRLVHSFPVIYSVLNVYGKDRALVNRLRESIAEHCERIGAASHLLWPAKDHNHYTEEICGMLCGVAMIPEHPNAERWAEHAMEGIEVACRNQLTEDGAQVEGAALYHSAVVINFLYAMNAARSLGKSFSEEYVCRVRNGAAFAIHTLCPNGETLPYGDSDPKYTEPIRAALIGALVLDEPGWLNTLKTFLPGETMRQVLFNGFPWGIPHLEELLDRLAETTNASGDLLPLTNVQHQTQQFFTRSGWNRDAAYLYFSCCSPIHHGAHGHMDQLGVIFGAYGKTLIQDPGRFTYKTCEDRHFYKSSQAHSVPTVDGRDAFEYIATFEYGPQQPGCLTAVVASERIRSASGSHMNYAPAAVSRAAALVDGKILLIADTWDHALGRQLAVFFHINSVNVKTDTAGVHTEDNGANLQIVSTVPTVKLLEGRLSDQFYHEYPATRALFRKTAASEHEIAVFAAIANPPGKHDEIRNLSYSNGLIRFLLGDEEYKILFDGKAFTIA